MFVFWSLFFFSLNTYSINHIPLTIIPSYDESVYEREIQVALDKLSSVHDKQERLVIASALYLGKPYVLFPNGEGSAGRFDKNPLYRTDVFDCLTYVTTVIALAESEHFSDFQTIIRALNYENGYVDFLTRNHFVSVDYNQHNQHNQQAGYLKDITNLLKDAKGVSVSVTQDTVIDKPAWIAELSPARIHLFEYPGDIAARDLLNQLHAQSGHLHEVKGHLDYIPLSALFTPQGEARLSLFNQIPSGAIIEIIKPNTPESFSTHLYVSHLGFAVRTSQGLQFREASSVADKVIDISLIAYLRSYFLDGSALGINLEAIVM